MTARTLALAAVATALGASPGASARAGQKAAPDPGAKGLPSPEVKQWSLGNGLGVLFVPDHKAPVVSVQVFYHVGGKDEPEGRRGMAHMFEHMMFKGSRHVAPEQHARFVDSVGGNENAFTQDDLTGYHDTVPPAALEFMMKLEAERMRNLELTQKTINSEREVVKEELRVNFENRPISQALQQLRKLAFKSHPYRELAIGNQADLDRVTVADCQKFYDTFYRPNNALLIVVGDTDEATVRRLADQYFAPLERGPEIRRAIAAEPPQREKREATLTLPVQLPVIIGAFHAPAASDADVNALEVLQQILSGGESSRMYQRLVRKDKLAVAAGGILQDEEDPGLFITFAVYLPGGDPAKIRAALDDEIAKVNSGKVTEQELAKARSQLAARAVFQRERVSQIATRIGVDALVAHDPLRAWSAAAKYDAVTAADVQRVAQKYLVSTNQSLVTLQPKGGAQ